MSASAEAAGLTLQSTGAFRTMAEQRKLRREKPNLAARPGFSNHQNGIAVDIETNKSKIYEWLTVNAVNFGFVRTVPWEAWHWEFRPQNSGNQFMFVKRAYNQHSENRPFAPYRTKSGQQRKGGRWPALARVAGDLGFASGKYQPGSWVDEKYWKNDKVTHGATKAKRAQRTAQRAADKKKQRYEDSLAKLRGWLAEKEGQKSGTIPYTGSPVQLAADIARYKKNIAEIEKAGPTGDYSTDIQKTIDLSNMVPSLPGLGQQG